MNWSQYFHFPEDKYVSKLAKDLIKNLICDVDNRLGNNGAAEIKRHPFFKQIDWENIQKMRTPFIPEVKYIIYKDC